MAIVGMIPISLKGISTLAVKSTAALSANRAIASFFHIVERFLELSLFFAESQLQQLNTLQASR